MIWWEWEWGGEREFYIEEYGKNFKGEWKKNERERKGWWMLRIEKSLI